MITRDKLLSDLRELGIRVPPSGFLKRSDIETFLGSTQVTLRKWRQSGVGPRAVKHGGQWVYHVDDFLQWLNEGELGPKEPPKEAPKSRIRIIKATTAAKDRKVKE